VTLQRTYRGHLARKSYKRRRPVRQQEAHSSTAAAEVPNAAAASVVVPESTHDPEPAPAPAPAPALTPMPIPEPPAVAAVQSDVEPIPTPPSENLLADDTSPEATLAHARTPSPEEAVVMPTAPARRESVITLLSPTPRAEPLPKPNSRASHPATLLHSTTEAHSAELARHQAQAEAESQAALAAARSATLTADMRQAAKLAQFRAQAEEDKAMALAAKEAEFKATLQTEIARVREETMAAVRAEAAASGVVDGNVTTIRRVPTQKTEAVIDPPREEAARITTPTQVSPPTPAAPKSEASIGDRLPLDRASVSMDVDDMIARAQSVYDAARRSTNLTVAPAVDGPGAAVPPLLDPAAEAARLVQEHLDYLVVEEEERRTAEAHRARALEERCATDTLTELIVEVTKGQIVDAAVQEHRLAQRHAELDAEHEARAVRVRSIGSIAALDMSYAIASEISGRVARVAMQSAIDKSMGKVSIPPEFHEHDIRTDLDVADLEPPPSDDEGVAVRRIVPKPAGTKSARASKTDTARAAARLQALPSHPEEESRVDTPTDARARSGEGPPQHRQLYLPSPIESEHEMEFSGPTSPYKYEVALPRIVSGGADEADEIQALLRQQQLIEHQIQQALLNRQTPARRADAPPTTGTTGTPENGNTAASRYGAAERHRDVNGAQRIVRQKPHREKFEEIQERERRRNEEVLSLKKGQATARQAYDNARRNKTKKRKEHENKLALIHQLEVHMGDLEQRHDRQVWEQRRLAVQVTGREARLRTLIEQERTYKMSMHTAAATVIQRSYRRWLAAREEVAPIRHAAKAQSLHGHARDRGGTVHQPTRKTESPAVLENERRQNNAIAQPHAAKNTGRSRGLGGRRGGGGRNRGGRRNYVVEHSSASKGNSPIARDQQANVAKGKSLVARDQHGNVAKGKGHIARDQHGNVAKGKGHIARDHSGTEVSKQDVINGFQVRGPRRNNIVEHSGGGRHSDEDGDRIILKSPEPSGGHHSDGDPPSPPRQLQSHAADADAYERSHTKQRLYSEPLTVPGGPLAMYERSLRDMQLKDQWRKERESSATKRELAPCTFMPKVNGLPDQWDEARDTPPDDRAMGRERRSTHTSIPAPGSRTSKIPAPSASGQSQFATPQRPPASMPALQSTQNVDWSSLPPPPPI
jgi:hypothetical protein